MNKLRQDVRAYCVSLRAVYGCLLALAVLKAIQVHTGLSEPEYYRHHPVSFWLVVSLGIAFLLSLSYWFRKRLDINPAVQLPSEPDDALERILADPEYKLWHAEAQRLLTERHSGSVRKKRRRLAHLAGLLFAGSSLLYLIDITQHGHVRPGNEGTVYVIGLLLYMAAGLFALINGGQWTKGFQSRYVRSFVSLALYALCLVWLLGGALWIFCLCVGHSHLY